MLVAFAFLLVFMVSLGGFVWFFTDSVGLGLFAGFSPITGAAIVGVLQKVREDG